MNRKIADGLPLLFQHTAARRRLDFDVFSVFWCCVSTHSRPKAAERLDGKDDRSNAVSTHSRPKAAGSHSSSFVISRLFQHTAARRRLLVCWASILTISSFNTQPPEGGWWCDFGVCGRYCVSTHSRPKAAEPLLKALFHQVSQPRFR